MSELYNIWTTNSLTSAGVFWGGTFVLSTILTWIVLQVCRRMGWVPAPKEDRWSKLPVPIYGGVALFTSFVLVVAFITAVVLSTLPPSSHEGQFFLALIAGNVILFTAGLTDDIRPLGPHTKLLCQLVVAGMAVAFGIRLHLFGNPIIEIPLSIFWFVGITNAFNLLDNMDGLSAGTAAISAALLGVFSLGKWPISVTMGLFALSGAATGFLVFNFNPARIFMGDSGSMTLGYSLALFTMGSVRLHDIHNILPPVLVLVVPLFDTALVMMVRPLHGRGIFTGGTDHLSHRLVALGLSERKAVLLLYLITALLGGVILFSRWIDRFGALVLAVLSLVAMFYFTVFLGQIKVYAPIGNVQKSRFFTRFRHFSPRITEMLLDVLLFSGAFIAAYLIRFQGIPDKYYEVIFRALPLFIVIKLICFISLGMYRGFVRQVKWEHIKQIVFASSLGSLISVLMATMAWRFTDFSRAVFCYDLVVTIFFITLSRSLLSIFRNYFRGVREHPLGLVGTPFAIQALVAELDDSVRKNISGAFVQGDVEGEEVAGVPVLGSVEDVKEKELPFFYLLILRGGLDDERRKDVEKTARKRGLEVLALKELL